MIVTEIFPSKYLKGIDLKGPVTVTIEDVRAEIMYLPGKGQVTGYVLYCQRAKKGVILTRALAMQIALLLGDPDTDNWCGKRITLYGEPMTVAGIARVAIRARAAQ